MLSRCFSKGLFCNRLSIQCRYPSSQTIPYQLSKCFMSGGVEWHGTTILCVRKDGHVVIAGDGQVSAGSSVVKSTARKVRKIGDDIVVGFAGSTADAMTLLERLERKLEEHPGQLTRACVELAKAWRTDKYLRRLEVTFPFYLDNVTYL